MANELATRIRELTHAKIDFVHDEAEGQVKTITDATLSLDDAADAFIGLANDDMQQNDVANALVDLADLFDDVNLTGSQREKVNGVVDRLVKTGNADQIEAAKKLFAATLDYGLAAKSVNTYFDTLLSEDPNDDGGGEE